MNAGRQIKSERWAYLDQALGQGLKREKLIPANGRVPSSLTNSEPDFVSLPVKGVHPRIILFQKIQGIYRSDRFRDFIGNSILRFRTEQQGESKSTPLLLAVYFDRYSPRAISDLEEYSYKYVDGKLNWLIVSASGKVVMRLLGKDAQFELDCKLVASLEAKSDPSRYALFSERNQWLFKCLLLPGISASYWGGAQKKASSVVELAEIANVPQPAVSIFLKQAEAAGYLRRERGSFLVVRHRELLEEWSYAAKFNSPESENVRPIFGQSFEQWSQEHPVHQHDPSYVAGSHLACRVMGLGRSNNPEKLFYVQDPFDQVMARLDLVPDPSESPWAKLTRPKYPELIFRGAVWRNHIWIVDILQAYSDVRLSPARGMEQAEVIYMSRLHKHFEGS